MNTGFESKLRSPVKTTEEEAFKRVIENSVSPKRKQSPSRYWRREEDELLLKTMADFEGEPRHKFRKISEHMSDFNRTYKQCRERWINHLKPGIRKGGWTPEEDAFIIDQVRIMGNKWSTISRKMDNRTDGDVKNRYNSIAKQIKLPVEQEFEELSFKDEDFFSEVIKMGEIPNVIAERDPLDVHPIFHPTHVAVKEPVLEPLKPGGFYLSTMTPSRKQEIRCHMAAIDRSVQLKLDCDKDQTIEKATVFANIKSAFETPPECPALPEVPQTPTTPTLFVDDDIVLTIPI